MRATWWRGVEYALVSQTLDEAIPLVRVMVTARVEITASRIAGKVRSMTIDEVLETYDDSVCTAV